MHMADGLVSPAVATTMYVVSGLAAAYSIHKLKKKIYKQCKKIWWNVPRYEKNDNIRYFINKSCQRSYYQLYVWKMS